MELDASGLTTVNVAEEPIGPRRRRAADAPAAKAWDEPVSPPAPAAATPLAADETLANLCF